MASEERQDFVESASLVECLVAKFFDKKMPLRGWRGILQKR